MSPTTRRQRARRHAWLTAIALVVLPLATLAAIQFVLLLRTLPVRLPEPIPNPAAKLATTGPDHSQTAHPPDSLAPLPPRQP